MEKGTICELELDEGKVKQFKDAIENNYWFEFFLGKSHTYFFFFSFVYRYIFVH